MRCHSHPRDRLILSTHNTSKRRKEMRKEEHIDYALLAAMGLPGLIPTDARV